MEHHRLLSPDRLVVWAFYLVCCGFEGFAMGSKRLDWIDIAKGIAIILVIVGHTVPNPSPLRHAIFSFHMPVFFILAGYTFRPKPWRELLSGSVSRLLVPYVVLALAWQVPTFLMSGAPLTSGTLVAGLTRLCLPRALMCLGLALPPLAWHGFWRRCLCRACCLMRSRGCLIAAGLGLFGRGLSVPR